MFLKRDTKPRGRIERRVLMSGYKIGRRTSLNRFRNQNPGLEDKQVRNAVGRLTEGEWLYWEARGLYRRIR